MPDVGEHIMTVDGMAVVMESNILESKIKARLAGQSGDIREPDWGPFQKQ